MCFWVLTLCATEYVRGGDGAKSRGYDADAVHGTTATAGTAAATAVPDVQPRGAADRRELNLRASHKGVVADGQSPAEKNGCFSPLVLVHTTDVVWRPFY